MKVYTSTDFEGHWPVGVAMVVVARGPETAKKLADQSLVANGLKPQFLAGDAALEELDTSKGHAVLLCNGDY